MSFYRFARAVMGVYVKIFYRVEYFGRENEPSPDVPTIVLSNHSSFIDPVFTAKAVRRDLTFIAKSTLAEHFPLGLLLKLCRAVTIRRGESDVQAVRTVCGELASGKSLGIYPQGTRMPGVVPSPEQALAGVGLMASRSKAALLPVAICCGKNKKGKPCIFRKVRVYVGKPVYYDEYSSAGERGSSHEIARYGFAKVCELYEKYN